MAPPVSSYYFMRVIMVLYVSSCDYLSLCYCIMCSHATMCPHTGGVGHIMIQIARAFDIQVITPLLPLYTSTAQALVRFHEGSMKSISRLC